MKNHIYSLYQIPRGRNYINNQDFLKNYNQYHNRNIPPPANSVEKLYLRIHTLYHLPNTFL